TMKRIIKWFSTNSKSYYGLFSCQEHGLIKGRFRIKSTDDKQYYAIRILKCTDEEGGKKIKMRQQREKEHRRAKRLGTL
ncbi:MAG: DNA polymerase III, partial [Clostridium sp.]|nr:DNA polymerase III [Clostridium sp.]